MKEATNRASTLNSLPMRLLNEYNSKVKAVSGLNVTQETSFKKVYIETKGYSNFETRKLLAR